MRYRGQAYERSVPSDGQVLDANAREKAGVTFHDLHEASFAHADRDETPEIVTVRLNAIGRLRRPDLEHRANEDPAEPKAVRTIWHNDERVDVPVFERTDFGEQDSASGPLIVDDVHSTIFLPSGWWIEGTGTGDLIAQQLSVNPMAALYE